MTSSPVDILIDRSCALYLTSKHFFFFFFFNLKEDRLHPFSFWQADYIKKCFCRCSPLIHFCFVFSQNSVPQKRWKHRCAIIVSAGWCLCRSQHRLTLCQSIHTSSTQEKTNNWIHTEKETCPVAQHLKYLREYGRWRRTGPLRAGLIRGSVPPPAEHHLVSLADIRLPAQWQQT